MLATTTAEPERAWMQAADAGDVAALQSLLAAHPHLLNARVHHQTFKQSTALHVAAWRDHSHAVEFLVDQGADIELQDQTGMTALQIDVMRVCLQKMRPTVLRRSRCLDSQSPVALALAKRMQVRDRSSYRDIDTSVLDLLLDHDACVDKSNEVGDTALLNAVEYGLIKHVEKLLVHGADVHAQDQSGRSAMDIAGEHGFVDIVNVLVERCPELLHSVGVESLSPFFNGKKVVEGRSGLWTNTRTLLCVGQDARHGCSPRILRGARVPVRPRATHPWSRRCRGARRSSAPHCSRVRCSVVCALLTESRSFL